MWSVLDTTRHLFILILQRNITTSGRATNYTRVFKAVRPKRISHSQKEANKLHLRLDKLVSALLPEIQAGRKNLKGK